MVTILDVAGKAGVSRSTVSLVLNSSPLVKEETRRQVQEVIRELNYVPNNNARGLSSKTTNNLGIVVLDKTLNPSRYSYESDQRTGMCTFSICNGIMSRLLNTDYGVVTEHFDSLNASDELPKIVSSRRVDGVLLVGTPYSPRLIDSLRTTGLPFVIAGVDSYEDGVDSVYADPGVGAVLAIKQLYDTGHKKICFVNGPRNYHSSHTRIRAVTEYNEKNGKGFNYDWLLYCEHNHGQSGYKIFKDFWEKGNRPDGIVTANPYLALGIMSYLYEQDIRIPDELSIISYEDSALCGYSTPGLSSINICKELIGEQAAQCLIERIEKPDVAIKKIAIPPFFVERDSIKKRG